MTDESIFAAALAIGSPADRAAFLDRACAGDPARRREVEELLAAHSADNPLDRPPADLARTGAYEPGASAAGVPGSPAVGDRVGPYRLMEQIGEGGFGLVFVAEQTAPVRRKVALKVLKPGMDTRDVVARFEAERQALALMEHPNIAKVLDAGTTPQGRPYFVMELVRGVPVTDFCDQQRLPPRDRLALFVQVCQAVQHAHTKGVIHRDLKPSNVLVTVIDGVPIPKVIDFGVAKAVGQSLTDKTVYTRFQQMIGTPLYMSPEQAEMSGVDVDTRADVYALGVLLYELLTGTTPFDRDRFRKAALDEIRRIIREEEPPKPSTRLSSSDALPSLAANRGTEPAKLPRLVRGELDWVVMRCLEKDRNRRYETASALAKDVHRFLAGDAVEACPPSLGYRLRKFCDRNRTALVIAFVYVVSIKTASLFSIWQMSRAFVAETIAERERDEAAWQRDAAIKAGEEAARQRDETDAALRKLRLAQEQQQADQYVWDMQVLPLAFEAGNVAEVNRLLDRHRPAPGQADRRGFEWYYWDRQLHTDLRTDRLPDAGEPRGTWAVSPDGSRVARLAPPAGATARENALVLTVWDVAARKVVLTHRLPPPKPDEQNFAMTPAEPRFSPDGTRVSVGWSVAAIGGGGPGTMPGRRQVLDVTTGRVLLDIDGGEAWPRLHGDGGGAFSPDGRRFAAVVAAPDVGPGRGRGRVWDLETGKDVCEPFEANRLAGSAFGPDGDRLVTVRLARAAALQMRVSVRDLTRGAEVAGWDVPLTTMLQALALSPDGARVAGVTGERPPKGATSLLVPAEPRTITIWEAATGKELHTLPLPRTGSAGIMAVRVFFSPEGSRLAVERVPSSARTGSGGSDLTLWDPVTGKPLPPLAGFVDTSAARNTGGPAFSPDGRQLVGTDGNVLRTWDTGTGRLLLTLRGHARPIGVRAFVAGGARLWSLESGGLLKEWDARPPAPVAIPVTGSRYSPRLTEFAVSPDGGRAATLIESRNDQEGAVLAVRVWDTTGKRVALLVPPRREPAKNSADLDRLAYTIALSRDGRRAVLARAEVAPKPDPATAAPDFTVWDVETRTVLLHQKLDGVFQPSFAISPDGSKVAVVARPTEDGSAPAVRVFDVAARRESRSIPVAGARAVVGLSFAPDGRRLAAMTATGVADGGRLVVWDAESGEPVSAAGVGSAGRSAAEFSARMAWSPDGSRFVASGGTWDRPAVVVHDTATGRPLVTMEQPLTGEAVSAASACVAFSPDGRRVAALLAGRAAGPAAVKVWDAASGKELLALRPPSAGGWEAKRLTFTGDGHRLVFVEFEPDPDTAFGGLRSRGVTRPLLLTTWDATPVAGREPGQP